MLRTRRSFGLPRFIALGAIGVALLIFSAPFAGAAVVSTPYIWTLFETSTEYGGPLCSGSACGAVFEPPLSNNLTWSGPAPDGSTGSVGLVVNASVGTIIVPNNGLGPYWAFGTLSILFNSSTSLSLSAGSNSFTEKWSLSGPYSMDIDGWTSAAGSLYAAANLTLALVLFDPSHGPAITDSAVLSSSTITCTAPCSKVSSGTMGSVTQAFTVSLSVTGRYFIGAELELTSAARESGNGDGFAASCVVLGTSTPYCPLDTSGSAQLTSLVYP